MEKTMVVNLEMVGKEDTKESVKNRKRNHVATWLEVLKDVHKQSTEAELGR